MKSVIYKGKKASLRSRALGAKSSLISQRLGRGWDIKRAFNTPPKKKKWESRQAYLKDYRQKNKARYKVYILKNKERVNRINREWRQRHLGRVPNEVWRILVKDKEVWLTQRSGLRKRDPQAWNDFIQKKWAAMDASLIKDRCVDCEILFAEHPRAAHAPNYCQGCWGDGYIRKQAKNKTSLLYNPARVV